MLGDVRKICLAQTIRGELRWARCWSLVTKPPSMELTNEKGSLVPCGRHVYQSAFFLIK